MNNTSKPSSCSCPENLASNQKEHPESQAPSVMTRTAWMPIYTPGGPYDYSPRTISNGGEISDVFLSPIDARKLHAAARIETQFSSWFQKCVKRFGWRIGIECDIIHPELRPGYPAREQFFLCDGAAFEIIDDLPADQWQRALHFITADQVEFKRKVEGGFTCHR